MSGERGKLVLGQETTKRERPDTNGPHVEAPTITAGEIRRTVQDAQRSLSLDERFVDHGEVGRGGMGAVHRVYERSLGRHVALKWLPQDRALRPRSRDRFLAEAQINGQLEHPNIVPVHELGQDDDGAWYFTMRLVEGQTLTEFLGERRGHDEVEAREVEQRQEQAMEVFFRVCDALSFAHSRGVLHRDVKPSNIMVGEHGQVYLMDWGVAFVSDTAFAEAEPSKANKGKKSTTLTTFRIDEAGLVVGTYAYMSPEQTRGDHESMDARTDVFGLGAVLFRILTGRPPFGGKHAAEALELASECRLPVVDEDALGVLGRELLRVARQAMQRDKEQRFQSVKALKGAVQGVLRGRQRFPAKRFRAGEVIVAEGERGQDAYYIRSGRCRVYRVVDGEQRNLRTLEAGDVFGETAVFTGAPRNAMVAAVDEVELTIVPGAALSDAVGLDTWMGAFVRSLGARFSERSRRVTELDLVRARLQNANKILALMAQRAAPALEVSELARATGLTEEVVRETASLCATLALEADRVRVA